MTRDRMTRDVSPILVSPILDRHTLEGLGRMLRERLGDAHSPTPSDEIEMLLASLRAADGGRDEGRSTRR